MNIFKSKRLKYALTIEDVAAKILVSPHIIEDLEGDNYKAIPAPFGYYCAKSYADFLEVNVPEVIKKTKPITAR